MSALSEARSNLDLQGMVGPIIWAWFYAHQDDVIYQVKTKVLGVIPVSLSVRVRDCKLLISKIAGPEIVPPPPGTH